MTRPGEAAAVEAGADRLLASHPSWFKRLSTLGSRGTEDGRYAAQTLAEAVVREGYPVIAAAVREAALTEAAETIERSFDPGGIGGPWSDGMATAARIVRSLATPPTEGTTT